MDEVIKRRNRLNRRIRNKNPEFCNIVSTKTTKKKLKDIADAYGLSLTGLLEWWVEEIKLPAVPPKGLAIKYPSAATAYKKTWKILTDYTLELVQNRPGFHSDFYAAHRKNWSERQIEAALEWLCREGRITRTVAGHFPVSTDTPG